MDSSFGTKGLAVIDAPGTSDTASTVLRLADRRAVPAGVVDSAGIQVTRLAANGAVDTGFGTAGATQVPAGAGVRVCGLHPAGAGRVLVTGTAGKHFVFLRLRPDGKPDSSYGKSGVYRVDAGAAPSCGESSAAPGGKVLFTGGAGAPGARRAVTGRLGSSGKLDRSFGISGLVTEHLPTARDERFVGAASVAKGRILAMALLPFVSKQAPDRQQPIRYTADGRRDRSYSRTGAGTLLDGAPTNVAVGTKGRTVVLGGARAGRSEIGVRRIGANGRLDPSFGRKGVALFEHGNPEGGGVGVVRIAPNGRILVLFTAGDEAQYVPYVARLQG